MWSYKNLPDDDDDDAREKLTALYREDWKSKSVDELMDKKCFRKIPEFLTSNKKTLKCESVSNVYVFYLYFSHWVRSLDFVLVF